MVIQLGNKNSNFGLSRAYLYAYRLGILSVFILFLLGIHLFLPISIDTNVAEGAALPSTTELAINTDYSSANLDFTTISSTGTFASSSAEDIAKFTVTTNNYTGYTLTLAGNDDTGQLNNISTGAALDSIATSGIESSSFSTNEWGYLPSKYNSEANTTKYYSAPTTSDADTLDVTNAANASNTPNEYTISLGAKVDYSKPAGTYTNTFILAAVGNPVNYAINYLDGTNDPTVQNLPTAQSSTTGSSSVVLNPNKTPTRTGYTFSGKYCLGTVNTTGANPGTTCTGTQYQSGDTIDFVDQTAATSAVNLYAIWTPNKYNITIKTVAGIDSVSLNGTSCTSTSGCTVSNLSYNNTYTLTAAPTSGYKLTSWALATATGAGTIADATSGNTTFTVGLGTNTITPTAVALPYIQDYTSSTCQANASSQAVSVADKRDGKEYRVRYVNGNCWMVDNLRYVGDTGSTSGSMVMKSATSNIDTDKTIAYNDLTSGDSYDQARLHVSTDTSYGVYYNYAAASAMTVTGSSNSTDATYDICPKGWRLPTNAEQSTIGTRTSTYVSTWLPVYGGYYGNGTLYNESVRGFWWSSTSYNSLGRYNMFYIDTGELWSGGGGNFNRDSGIYARCIHMPYSTTITFDGNGATDGKMDEQVFSGDSVPSGALATNGYTRTGYVFTGWNTQANGSGTSYADGATYTATSTSETSRTLYAQWAESGGYIQDYTKSTCQANASSAPIYLTDKRDNKVYRARYVNGNCWMVDNLRFVGKTSDVAGTMTLDSTTSNVASTYTVSNPLTITYNDLTSGNDYTDARLHVSDNTSYGVYYNYSAATAKTITGSSNDTTATYDICPKGWRLPTNYEQYTISTYVSTWLPVHGGIYSDGSLVNESIVGYWWSSQPYFDTTRNYLYYSANSGTLVSGDQGARYYGVYVRCIRAS